MYQQNNNSSWVILIGSMALTKKALTLAQTIPVIFIMLGSLGFIASFALTYDKIQVITDPSYVPDCNINPVLSCGSVMKTEQANLLGVPNTIFGLIGYTAMITIGVVMLTGSKINRKLWLAVQAAATMGVVFMHYLFFQGVFRINAICPWCFLTWMVTIPIFWYTTLYTLELFKDVLKGRLRTLALAARRYHGDVLGVWYLAIFVILITEFWYYWETLLP